MMGFFFFNRKYYLVSTASTCSTTVESTEVESNTLVESTATAVESDFTSVDVPVPQDANATIDKIARIFFMFFLFFRLMFNNLIDYKYTKSNVNSQIYNIFSLFLRASSASL